MNRLVGVAVLVSGVAMTLGAMQAAEQAPLQQPAWAYAIPPAPPPGATPPAPARDDGKIFSMTGSTKQFTFNQIRGRRDNDTPARIAPADWFPGDHPNMPKIVSDGDESRGIIACSLCHYPNGKGRAENAAPAGLPKEYIVRTLKNMKNDQRASAERRKNNTQAMVSFAKAMTDQEIDAAADYFAAMKWTPWIKVVESDISPKVRSAAGLYIPLEGADAGTEPLGNRIVEVPENPEATEMLRHPRSGFVAYVPIGSVAKGKDLATTGGNGKTTACTICHGADLNGVGSVPGIGARSPSYNARQLNDFKQGARHGDMADLMRNVVANLSQEDVVNLTAYLASLPAPAAIAYQQAAN